VTSCFYRIRTRTNSTTERVSSLPEREAAESWKLAIDTVSSDFSLVVSVVKYVVVLFHVVRCVIFSFHFILLFIFTGTMHNYKSNCTRIS